MISPLQPLPRFPKAEDIIPAMKSIIAKHDEIRNYLVKTITPETANFGNVVRPLAELDNITQGIISTIHVLEEVTGSSKAVQAGNIWKKSQNEWKARGDLFKLLNSVIDKTEDLEPESRLWLEKELFVYTLAGHGRLSEAQLEEFKQGQTRIDELLSEFFKNLQQEKGGIWYEESELAGVPDDKIKGWREATAGHDNVSDNEAKIFVPFSNGGWMHVLRFAKLEDSRRRMSIAFEKGPEGNSELVRELLLRRDSQARLLGFSSHAGMRSLTTAVKSVDWVKTFLSDLREGILPKQTEAIKKLQGALARDRLEQGVHEQSDGEEFAPWNFSYCSRLVQESMHVDQGKVADYFPIEHTTKYMLNAFACFLGLDFVKIPNKDVPSDCTWNEDVEVWSVWDHRDKPATILGYLYLDLMWREEKSPGYFNHEIECVRRAEIFFLSPHIVLIVSTLGLREDGWNSALSINVVMLLFRRPKRGHLSHSFSQ